MKKRLLLLAILLLSAVFSQAATVTLAWDYSTDPSVVNYNIYYGPAHGIYTNYLTVCGGNNVTFGCTNGVTIPNLVAGATYYFAATSIASNGLESSFSPEISYSVTNSPSGKPGPPVLNSLQRTR